MEDASDDGSEAPQPRARRHSKKVFNPRSNDPTQIAFYPASWQEVLGAAKMHWRLRVATEWGFPKLRERRHNILACLTQAITEYENENGSLEQGMNHTATPFIYSFALPGYHPESVDDMIKLVSLCINIFSPIFCLTTIYSSSGRIRLLSAAR